MFIIDYKTVAGYSEEELDQNVKELIAQGWQPYGSPYEDSSETYLQAMVKYSSFQAVTKRDQ